MPGLHRLLKKMRPKRILVISGHPDKESLNAALTNAYVKGAKSSGSDVEVINIRDLDFNPNLKYGYKKRTELESDLLNAQSLIHWADHLAWIYPVWWGSVPAIMKGFIDRVFLPEFAFKKRPGSVWWDKYLTDKTARLICTMDQPPWFYRLRYGSPSHKAMKQMTLQYVGIKKVKITSIGPIRLSKESFRKKWLNKVEGYAKKDAS